MRRLSPDARAVVRVPERVGLRSSERALLARFPCLKPTLSVMRVILALVEGLVLSRISLRVLEAAERFPAASAILALKAWVRLVARGLEWV